MKRIFFNTSDQQQEISFFESIGKSDFFLSGWVGFQKYYVIIRVGHGRCLCLLTRWVGGVKKGQKNAYVIFEWSLMTNEHATE